MERLWRKPCKLTVCLVAAVLASCSVKEDRAACPCILILDVSSVDAAIVPDAGLMVFQGQDKAVDDSLRFGENDTFSFLVPRGNLHLRVWAGGGEYVTDEGLNIPLGEDCPRVYMHDSDLNTVAEQAYEVVQMRKNHSVLTIMTDQGKDFAHDMTVIGNVAGYSSTGMPLDGRFEYGLEKDRYDEGWKVVLPRQMDSSLILQVNDRKENVKNFALGQYIVASGYDWSSPDLEDITIALDYALTYMTIKINGWEGEYTFNVVL